jgi:hypothetical protein
MTAPRRKTQLKVIHPGDPDWDPVAPRPVDEINRLHRELAAASQTLLGKFIRIGELLTKEKNDLNHGEWAPWLAKNVEFSERTAQRYMKVYANRQTLDELSKSDTMSLLGLTEALQILGERRDPVEVHVPASETIELLPEEGGEENFPHPAIETDAREADAIEPPTPRWEQIKVTAAKPKKAVTAKADPAEPEAFDPWVRAGNESSAALRAYPQTIYAMAVYDHSVESFKLAFDHFYRDFTHTAQHFLTFGDADLLHEYIKERSQKK